MATIIKTVKTDYKSKGLSISEGKFVDEDGEVIDDIAVELEKVFGDAPFDLTVTKSVKEEISPEDINE